MANKNTAWATQTKTKQHRLEREQPHQHLLCFHRLFATRPQSSKPREKDTTTGSLSRKDSKSSYSNNGLRILLGRQRASTPSTLILSFEHIYIYSYLFDQVHILNSISFLIYIYISIYIYTYLFIYYCIYMALGQIHTPKSW